MQAQAEKKRRISLNEAEVYTAIMSLLVILIHVTSEGVEKFERESVIFALFFIANKFASFVVPGFIFISAVKYFIGFSKNPDKKFNYPKFLLGRLIKVYIPYVIWVIIYYKYFLSRQYFPFSIKDLARYIFFGDLSGQFYFVVIIMQFYILMPLWRVLSRIKNKYAIAGVIIGSAAITWFVRLNLENVIRRIFSNPEFAIPNNNIIFTYFLLYFVIGIYAGTYYEKFIELIKKHRVPIYILYGIFASVHISASYANAREIFWHRYSEHMHIFFCLISMIFIYDICILISAHLSKLMPLFKNLSDISYYVYLSHVIFIFKSDQIAEEMGIISISTKFAMKCIAAYVIPIVGCTIYVQLKKFIIKKIK